MSRMLAKSARVVGQNLATKSRSRLAHTEALKGTDFSVHRESEAQALFKTTDDPLYRQIVSGLRLPRKKVSIGKDPTNYFSTPHDNVPRDVTEGLSARLWVLFEACVVTDLPRAFQLMKAIRDEAPQLTDEAIFQYLNAFSENQDRTLQEIDTAVSSIKSNFPSYYRNAKAYAVLLRAYMDREAPLNHCDQLLSSYHGHISSVFKFPDVIGAANILALVKHKRQYVTFFSTDDQPFLMQALSEAEGLEKQAAEEQPITMKAEEKLEGEPNADSSSPAELNPVSSANLKFIKRSLEALEGKGTESFAKELMSQLTNEDAVPFMQNENQNINFFELRNSLPEDAQQKFDEVLEYHNQRREQLLELRVLDSSQQKWKHSYDQLRGANAAVPKELSSYLWEWHTKLVPLIKQEIEAYKKMTLDDMENNFKSSGPSHRKNRLERAFGPYLCLLKPEKLATIAILELVKLTASVGLEQGVHTSRAVVQVGRAVELEFRSEQLQKVLQPQGFNMSKNSQDFKKLVTKSMPRVLKRLRASGNHFDEDEKMFWTQEIRCQVGSALITPLIEVAKIVVTGKDPLTNEVKKGVIPAFYHTYEYVGGLKVGLIRCHSQITDSLSQENIREAISPQQLPMLVQPRPWTTHASGGYLFSRSSILRTKNSHEQYAYVKAASKRGDLDKVFKGLNVLGNTQWTPNKRILEIVTQVWNSGEEMLEIPAHISELKLPDPPKLPEGTVMDPREAADWRAKRVEAANRFASNRSMRCDLNYRLEIARGFLGERIYFPHSLDFRGRTYPLSPHFNHLGNDLSRGLLIFWKGRKLGDNGLRWLKIHLANMFGLDKVSLQERAEFTEKHLEDIRDSARDPLGGQRWWMKADKPWQALATCFELEAAFNLEDPTQFISHQPVHQDGTCNGLQHYAALGGDYEGAAQVNLIPADRPKDIYTHVAHQVTERLKKEAAEGDEVANILKDLIARKVVKQTVMTNVYGVTYMGASQQIARRLEDLGFSKDDAKLHSRYLARRVFDAVRQLFHGAHLIQDWLAASADRISKLIRVDMNDDEILSDNQICRSSVIWTSPLGLPIVQPYRQKRKKQVETNLQTVYITDPYEIHEVDRRKQIAAFPPNFVHSLDATHMLKTAVACAEKNISFASVHDSFWTHAADVDVMNKAIREEFSSMHETNLVAGLKKEFEVRYEGFVYWQRITKQSPLAKKVARLREKLSEELGRPCTFEDEINLERKRRQFLKDPDPKVRESARSWLTTIQVAGDEEIVPIKVGGVNVLVPFKLDDIPPRGDFKASEVMNSTYFFS
ncbi:unnamed protein product [Kuraishia capsulata CBS 1993]|uniref:DNA-directed RNA polymerase n=1 Tax=Kuraishia capsulata CBS 1993 TaxID=1382522 RepID=W6MIL2_9ASCO|nr:uncharacterized protein KUCA_T00000162001 [Kuraishia capsulata CBS 1993]CDK24202.1 unnamed protein product [Kuraishia capsulata CBS 1993]